MKLTAAFAIFQVADLEKSLAYYTGILGFQQEFVYGEPPFYAGVTRNGIGLHLNSIGENSHRQGKGALYVYCDEVDAYHQLLTERGVIISSPLETQPYGMRDFQITDLDGNVICFGVPGEREGGGPG